MRQCAAAQELQACQTGCGQVRARAATGSAGQTRATRTFPLAACAESVGGPAGGRPAKGTKALPAKKAAIIEAESLSYDVAKEENEDGGGTGEEAEEGEKAERGRRRKKAEEEEESENEEEAGLLEEGAGAPA